MAEQSLVSVRHKPAALHPSCPTLRTQSGALSTNSSRIFFCCRGRDAISMDGFFKAWLRCPKGRKKQRAPDKQTRRGPTAPLAHRRPGYPLSGCVPAEPDSVSPGDLSIATNHRACQLTNHIPGPRSRLRAWLRTQILDMRWQLRRHSTYPPLTARRPHSSHAGEETSSELRQDSGKISRILFPRN